MNCPVCGSELTQDCCALCGLPHSTLCELYPTLMPVCPQSEPLSVTRRKTYAALRARIAQLEAELAQRPGEKPSDAPPQEPPGKLRVRCEGASYSVVGVTGVLRGTVQIPETIRGLPVTAIGRRALADCTEITRLILPSSLNSICEEAFCGCTKLQRAELFDSAFVQEGAFRGCEALELAIFLPNLYASSAWDLADTAFADCPKLTIQANGSGRIIQFAKSHNIPLTPA